MDGRPLLGNAYSPLELSQASSEQFSVNTSGERMSVGAGKLRSFDSQEEFSSEHSSGGASETVRRTFIPDFSGRDFLYQSLSHLLYPFSLLWLIPTRKWRSLQLQAFVPGNDKILFIVYQIRTIARWTLLVLILSLISDCKLRKNCVEYRVWFYVPFILYLSDVVCIATKYAMMSPQNYQNVLDGKFTSKEMSQFELSKWLFPTMSVLIREINTMAIIAGVPITAERFKFDYSSSYCSKGDDVRARSRWKDLRRVVYGHTETDGSSRVENARARWKNIKAKYTNSGNRRKDTNDASVFHRWLKIVSIIVPVVPALPYSNLAVLNTSKRAMETVAPELQMDDKRLPGALLLASVEHRSRPNNFRLCWKWGHAITPQSWFGWIVCVVDLFWWTVLSHVYRFKFSKGEPYLPGHTVHSINGMFKAYGSLNPSEWIFFIVSVYLRAIYLRLFVKNTMTVVCMYARRAQAMDLLDKLVKPRSRSFLPKGERVMNEILTVPPLLQLNSIEDVVAFSRLRSLLRKLGRQYKTRSALFFAQQLVVVTIMVFVFKLVQKEQMEYSKGAYEGLQITTLNFTIVAFFTFASIVFDGAMLNYSSKLVANYLYAKENDVRSDISGMITKSQVLNPALNLDILRKRELGDVLNLAVSRIQNQEPVKVLKFIPATFGVLASMGPLFVTAWFLFNDHVLSTPPELKANLTTTR